MKKITTLLLFNLPALILFAQNKTVELENVTVTGNMQVQAQKQTGRNISVIKGEVFNQLPVHSLDELLRYIPGVEIQQRGPQGSQSDLVIRGGTFQQVLVIIDGIKLNDPLTGHFSSYIPIHPSEIDRIEILKGAASAIYGSEAVGGVVHIITKTFAGKKTDGNKFNATAAAGEYGLLNGNAFFAHTKNNTEVAAGIITNNADGPALRGTHGFFHNTTANISFSQKMKKDWTLNFRTAVDFRKFNAQNFYTTFKSDTAKEEVKSWWNHLSINKKTNKGVLNFDAAFKKLRDKFWFTPNATPNDNKTNMFVSQLYYTSKINKQNGYTTGVQVLRKQIVSNDRGDHSLWHGAAYGILRHNFNNNFFLNESLRLEWDERYGAVLVPQLNAAWAPSNLTIRAAVGKSIRDADFTERYNNYNKALVTSGSIGNPDLSAERSWNFEAGIDYRFSNDLKLSTTTFYRDHSDLIDWTPTPYADMPRKENLSPTGSYALAKNVENVRTSGFELDLIYDKNFKNDVNLLAMCGFTWLNSENDDPVPSFYISSHAKYLVNFNTTLSCKSVSVSLSGLYKKRNAQHAAAINANITPSYFLMNLKASYKIPKVHSSLFVQVDNLFDKAYSDLLGSQMPGRWLSGGIGIAL